MLSIGEMSRRTGVKVPTIRFYEGKGLLSPAARTEGNQRRYDQAALTRLSFIRHARDLGLPLEDIAALISLERAEGTALDRAHDIARRQQARLRDRIARLERLERELDRIAGACDGQHDQSCAVLHAFSDHGPCAGPH
ncbi:MerR family transcriptional regulator [Pseudodonghicola flavimaris]|uniref:Helix-turn-helix domain-containing protein n=1 Tax=Pseudodonghicola flavimaris TaxID=3050036 RepID=A0ABT7F001_9RHOB|nr:helix-turn-helix domain-containing protein [Pseudodonghicola flavimaris]MDK3017928.1 helix-turn-helix domain-containing protein [Pseudodonghicola flavimaris]